MTIERSEYRARQTAFAAQLERAGLAGALVVSRGGSTFDRYADVLYLSGHYQGYSYLPDAPGLFSGRAHTALAITASGQSILCTSVPEYDVAGVVADEVRHSGDFTATISGALSSLGLDRGPVGLVGSDVLPFRMARALATELPGLAWRDCDEVLGALRQIKSPAEQAIIRRAAKLHVACLAAARAAAIPGNCEADLAAAFGQLALAGGAGLYFTALASGPEIARWTSHALPGFGRRPFRSGDMVRFDMGIVLEGYLSDFGRTLVVGGATADQRRLIDTVHLGIDAVLAAIVPGAPVKAVVAAGEAALQAAGVTTTDAGPGSIHASFPVHWGHGLGLGWERPWMAENEPLTIAPGMYLAIERTLTAAGVGTAAAEQTLLVGADGIEILSEGPEGRWS